MKDKEREKPIKIHEEINHTVTGCQPDSRNHRHQTKRMRFKMYFIQAEFQDFYCPNCMKGLEIKTYDYEEHGE